MGAQIVKFAQNPNKSKNAITLLKTSLLVVERLPSSTSVENLEKFEMKFETKSFCAVPV